MSKKVIKLWTSGIKKARDFKTVECLYQYLENNQAQAKFRWPAFENDGHPPKIATVTIEVAD